MLILEIAVGIVLAVIILRVLPATLASALVLGLIALLVITIALVWLNLKTIAIYIAAVGAASILYGVPFLLKDQVTKKYPGFTSLIRGEPPYDQITKQPLRIAVMACFSVAVASIAVGALVGALYTIDLISLAVAK